MSASSVSTQKYLDMLAAKISAETKNAVTEGIKEYHEKTFKPEVERLDARITKVKAKNLWKDLALYVSLGAHGKTVHDIFKNIFP